MVDTSRVFAWIAADCHNSRIRGIRRYADNYTATRRAETYYTSLEGKAARLLAATSDSEVGIGFWKVSSGKGTV